ncbi:hypothetical protein F2Q68_00011905 [Brassica cretica]|uniref:WAT1-related protein n=1 Tax=Brassica cretica TaxID=69181 RepID=A0A8S9L438_BRACR|nr:hypothetical protein F2Q68_00011905 [Brassica cretica]
MVKFDAKLWKAVFTMSIINIALSVVNVMFKKMLDQGINRMVATTYRLAAGTLFLIPFAIFMERHNRPKLTGTILCSLFFSALLGTSLVQYFFLVGLQNTSSTFALAFSNMVPSVTFALALVFRQETLNIKSKIGRAKVLGTMICVCGALGIVGSGLCYVGVSWCLQQRGPVFTSSFIPLIQVFAAFFSFSFLHEQIYCGR